MKAVMVSIRPEWVEKILNGKKTVEIRKTAPKLKPPFKCYIYETQGKTDTPWIDEEGHMIFRGRGQVVAEFVCDEIIPIRVYNNGTIQSWNCNNLMKSCVPYDDIVRYIGNNRNGHGWHISKLKIYEKPKKLREFEAECKGGCDIPFLYEPPCKNCGKNKLTRPPQSWCYVEELQ